MDSPQRRSSVEGTISDLLARDGSPRQARHVADASSLLLLQKIKSQAEEKRQLEEFVKQKQLELESARSSQIDNFEKIGAVQSERQQLLELNEELRAALDSEHERMERRAASLQNEIVGLKEAAARAEGQLGAFKQANVALERALTAMAQDLAAAHARVAELERGDLATARSEADRLRERVAVLEAESTGREVQAGARLAALQTEREALRASARRAREALADLEAPDAAKAPLQAAMHTLLESACALLPERR